MFNFPIFRPVIIAGDFHALPVHESSQNHIIQDIK